MKKLIFLIAIISISSFSLAQDTIKPGTNQSTDPNLVPSLQLINRIPIQVLEEFSVASDRIYTSYPREGKSVLIISAEEMKNTPAVSISEILVQYAGIDIRQRGPNGVQADVGIRGSTFDQVLVLINGVRMSDPQTGHHSLNIPVDISAIDRIEVIKGAGARVYGQNALAGVINIITKNPKDTFVSIKAVGGDFNLSDVTVAAGFKGKNSSNLISINNGASQGYKFNTDYNITNAFISSEIKLSGYDNEPTINVTLENANGLKPITEWKTKLTLMGGFTERKFGANGFYSSPLFKDQYEEIQTSVASAKLSFFKSYNTKFNVSAYWRRNQDEYVFLRFQPEVFRNMHINNTGGVNFNMKNNNKLGQTGFGIDISQVWIQSNNLGKRERKIQTAFLEHRFNFFKNRLAVTPGVQASYFSDFDGVILPGIDLNYRVNNDINLFANAGYTYRIPTYTDLFYVGRTNIGNPNLNPEIALSYEAGARFYNRNITLQASYFVREGNNIIDWTRPDASSPWQPNNLIKLNTSGVDFDGQVKIPWTKWVSRIGFGYTFLDQATTVDNGLLSLYALENLKNQVTSLIVFKYHENISHSFNYRYSDRVNLDDYSIVDTKLSYNNGKLLVYGEISNLLDQKYQETDLVIMPGRWFRIGVGYTFTKK
ncbi:TonB-dependent receptor [Flavobacteriales bacterium]|jgi:vitamin B12 transporter|nr:TonB-dependent receptor [Flavobacteriales bacterium]